MAQVKIRGNLVKSPDGTATKFVSGLKPADILAMMSMTDPTLTLDDIEIIGGKQSSLESPAKMNRLGIPEEDREEYLKIIAVGREFENRINALLERLNIVYIHEGIPLDTVVGSGCYIQNPDSVPLALQRKADTATKKH